MKIFGCAYSATSNRVYILLSMLLEIFWEMEACFVLIMKVLSHCLLHIKF